MNNSVIGVYENYSQARDAMNELIASGFDPIKLYIHPDHETSAQVGHTSTVENERPSGIRHFFHALFGKEEQTEHEHIYSEAVRRGNSLLRVDASTQEECSRATEIMQRYDPVNIDERTAYWKSDGWAGSDPSARSDPSAHRMTEEEVHLDRSHADPVFRQEGDSIISSGNAATNGEDNREISAARMEDDQDFRRHWQDAYGTPGERYEDYDAAYRYGYSLPADNRLRNNAWIEVEPDIRKDWEMRHPESAWEKVKDAIRYGMQRARFGAPH